MQQKSAAWNTALVQNVTVWRWGLDILAADEVTPLEDTTQPGQFASDLLLPDSAHVDIDTTSTTNQGTMACVLRNPGGRYLPGAPGFPSGGAGSQKANGLIWYTARYRPWIDLQTGIMSNGNPIFDRTYLGIYLLSHPQTQVEVEGGYVSLSMVDKAALLSKPNILTPSNLPTYTQGRTTVGGYPVGTSVDFVMRDLCNKAGVPNTRLNFTSSSATLQTDFPVSEGDEYWTLLTSLANSITHVLYFDSYGNLVRRPNPTTQDSASAYTFAPGPLATINELYRDTDLTNCYNHIIVIGAHSRKATVRGEAYVTDTSNPYHKNYIGERICYVGKGGKLGDKTPDPTIYTTVAATAKAQVILAQHLGQQETIEVKGRTICNLEAYDKVTANTAQAGLALDFLVQKVTWNLSPAGMDLTATRFYQAGAI